MSEQLTYNGHRFGFYEELQIRAFMEEGLSLRDAIAIHYCDFPEKVSDVLGVSYRRADNIIDRAIYRLERLHPEYRRMYNHVPDDPGCVYEPLPWADRARNRRTLGYWIAHPIRAIISTNRA